MSEQALTDPAPESTLGDSRARVLRVLREAGDAVDARHVAERTGLHRNTARFHLDGLVDAGLAGRETETRTRPGRPRMVYRATVTDAPGGRRSYRLLAEMLTSVVTHTVPDPARAAVAAGEAWGRYLAERPVPTRRIDAEEGIRRLTAVLEDAGFAPGAVEDTDARADGRVIPLQHCPFLEVAEQDRDVVCSLHLGLMRGVLEQVRAPLEADRLEPFVEPSLCLAHLAASSRTPAGADPTGAGDAR